jgi:2-phosphosulfolactate phosphatase
MQDGARVRFGWGPTELAVLLDGIDGPSVVVVVDVLSFSTAVVAAVDAGVAVRPVAYRPGEPLEVPSGDLLAGPRGDGRVSLSPGSLTALPAGTRVVLPSPNGATICAAAAGRGAQVLVGSLRNAAAVVRDLRQRLASDPSCAVVVIAAGERWPDGGLRPALEDLAGAALVLAGLPQDLLSAEARVAASTRIDVVDLAGCASARELVLAGYGHDVEVALERDASASVPVIDADGWVFSQG